MRDLDPTERLLVAAALLLAAGAVVAGGGGGLGWFAVLPCMAWGGALVAWHRSPDESMAAVALVTAGFLRLMLGTVGLGALLLVPVLARDLEPEQARPLAGAALGVHLAVFASHQLAQALGEPFPALATVGPGEVVAGAALFVPFFLLARRAP